MIKKFLISIGNTNTQMTVINKNYKLCETFMFKTKKILHDSDLFLKITGVAFVSSVVPEGLQLLMSNENLKVHRITWEKISHIINFSQVNPKTIGDDRLANALAAKELSQPLMIIDCGTAINTEIIVDDFFVGGAILPGRKLIRSALNMFTSQLPNVELSQDLPEPFGVDTRSAILTNDLFSAGGLKFLISKTEERLGKKLSIYLTGGDAKFFHKEIATAEVVRENLTILGLQIFARNLKQ